MSIEDLTTAMKALGVTSGQTADDLHQYWISAVKIRLGWLWTALDALRMDFDRTGEHDRANSILAAQEHVEALQREVGGL